MEIITWILIITNITCYISLKLELQNTTRKYKSAITRLKNKDKE
jgi:hypothetical protein